MGIASWALDYGITGLAGSLSAPFRALLEDDQIFNK
jgi:hypothetical protein